MGRYQTKPRVVEAVRVSEQMVLEHLAYGTGLPDGINVRNAERVHLSHEDSSRFRAELRVYENGVDRPVLGKIGQWFVSTETGVYFLDDDDFHKEYEAISGDPERHDG